MARNFIHSTASQPMVYPIYAGGTDKPVKVREIRIKGKANVVDPLSLTTPTGAVTEVSDEELELLKQNPAFQRHVERGFMRIRTEGEFDIKGMEARDNSRQLVDAEYAAGTDSRVVGSGTCQATAGQNDHMRGVKGVGFVSDSY